MQTSRGVRGASFTLVTPANHYPSRLPVFGDAPVVKLVTPRLVPSRIGQYLVTLAPGGGGAKRVDPGHEVFFYGLAGAGEGVAAGTDFELRAGAFAYLPRARARSSSSAATSPTRASRRRARSSATVTTSRSPTPASRASGAASCCRPTTRRSTST
jgi:(S)-ureidoglycine aminohydrolase